MSIKNRFPFVVGTGITFLLLLVLGSVALAQVSNNQDSKVANEQSIQETISLLVPGGPGFVSVGSRAFVTDEFVSETDYSCYFYDDELISYYWDEYSQCDFSGVLKAPVQLPHGSTLTKFIAYYIDDSEWGISM